MDDIVFFDTILPSAGLRCVAWLLPNGKWAHRWGPDNAWLAASVVSIDTTKNKDVYYGCSSFLLQAQDKDRTIGGRKQVNVAFVRSFWVDLDVGPPEEGKPPKYATQREAGAAIFRFAIKHKLPVPWLVDSGWGVHAYWPMDADMAVSDWKPVAEALKAALRADGVLFDPSRTADEASVLRPLGTRNHKHGTTRPVRLVHTGKVGTFAKMAAAFPPVAPAPIATVKLSAENAALGGGMGPEPSSALLMADHCGVMALMRDTRGNVDQPTWYYSLGVLAQTIEAPAICHAWSDGHPNYTATETNATLARVGEHGSTTCVKLADYQPAICAACPWNGKITSPIQLGREKMHPTIVETVERVIDKKGFATDKTTAHAVSYPYGIEHRNGRRVLTYTTPADGDKPASTDVFCNAFLVGVGRLSIDGIAHTEWEMDTREGPRRFVTANGDISKGGKDVLAIMGANEIYAPGKDRILAGYLTHWMQTLKDSADQVTAYSSFGWGKDEVFVLGETVLKPDGSEARALLGGQARKKQNGVTTKGDLATWVKLVDRAYNAPGQEAFQFQLGCAFAAPLLSLMNQVRGVTVYSHTPGSGVGKTTVQQVGLSAWGNWDEMMLAQNKATGNALIALLGAYQSLPIVYDELTNAPKADISELVFSMSSGRAKERLSTSGDLRTNNANWSTILLASGNSLLSEKLAQHRANPEAEISRLFEFTLDAAPHLSVAEANTLFPQFLDNYGHAGHAFARTLVTQRARIMIALQRMQAKLNAEFQMTQVERHWSALFAAVLVALHLCRGNGLLRFEVDPVKAWMKTRLEDNRGGRTASVRTPDELLGQMLDDMWPGVLVTTGQGSLYSNPPIPAMIEKLPVGPVIGRRVYSGATSDPASFLISRTAIAKWCIENGTSPTVLFNAALNKGMVGTDVRRHCLGKGVRAYQTSDNVYCWRFLPDIVDAAMGAPSQRLSMIQGGKP